MRYKKILAIVTILVIFLLVALLCSLKVYEGKEDKDASEVVAYSVGGEQVTALTAAEGVKVKEDLPDKKETATVYTYDGLETPGKTVEAYTEQMTAEDVGFTAVDEKCAQVEELDFTAGEGSVRLAKNAAEEGKVLSLVLTWKNEACTVTVDVPEGEVMKSQREEMTQMEAVDYLYAQSPARLGLEGDSMKKYKIYTISGIVFVDRRACMQLNIYSTANPEGTNQLAGIYLMSGNGEYLYRLDRATNMVTRL